MVKALVCYYSRTGNTEKMAVRIADAFRKEGLEADLKKAEDVAIPDL